MVFIFMFTLRKNPEINIENITTRIKFDFYSLKFKRQLTEYLCFTGGCILKEASFFLALKE